MRRFGRAEILFSIALLLGGTTLVSGLASSVDTGVVKSTDFDNTAASTGVGTPTCSNQSTAAGALHDFGDFPSCPGTAVAPTFPVNVPDNLAFSPGSLNAGIVFVKDGSSTVLYTASSPTPCGSIDECRCDSAELLTARLFNSYKRRGIGGLAPACPSLISVGTYDVKQKIGVGGFGGSCTSADFGPAGACRDLAPGESGVLQIQRTDLGGAPCGFTLSFGPAINNGKSLRIEPDFPHCALGATFAITNAGNTHGDDLLPDLLLQLKRNGVNGSVLFEVRTTVNSSPLTFSVTTTAPETDTDVHTDIANHLNQLFDQLGFRLVTAEVVPSAGAKSVVEPLAPGTYAAGPGVQVKGFGFHVYSIHYKAVPGMQVVSENIDPNAGSPTLNEWGMIILTGLLLASGYWLFRRQRRLAAI